MEIFQCFSMVIHLLLHHLKSKKHTRNLPKAWVNKGCKSQIRRRPADFKWPKFDSWKDSHHSCYSWIHAVCGARLLSIFLTWQWLSQMRNRETNLGVSDGRALSVSSTPNVTFDYVTAIFSTKNGYPVDIEEKTNMGSIISHRVSVTVYRFDSSQCITMWQWLWWFVLSMLTLDVGYVSSFHGCQERNKRVSGVDKGWRGWLGSHSFVLRRVRFARTSLLPKCPNVKTQRVF